MDFILFIYFSIVFLGLQGLWLFERETSLTMIMIGNALIIYHSLTVGSFDLLILTIMMKIAQLSRIWRGA